MKKILLLTICMLTIATSAWAGAALKATPENISFGKMPEGPPATKVVKLTNTGDAPVNITNISTSCACTNTKYSKSTLAPNESLDLEITYTTFKFPGKFEKFIWVETKELADKYTITLTGDVDPMPMGVLAVKPRKVKAGNVPVGETVTAMIPIINTGDAPMEVTKLMSSKSDTVFFDAEKDGKVSIAPGETKEVAVTVAPTKKGRYLDYVMVFSNARNATDKGYKVVVSAKGI